MLDFFKKEPDGFMELSYLMTSSMQIRHNSQRFSSNSTFRPPPRVTLTEQKKEAWLRDLANPNIPLRKLSRTIPHGTRNRSLLEQCCTKAIPIPRAVWFARCVGANELRGLKRKGASGITTSASLTSSAAAPGQASEATWIREWTEQVTEYIEKVIKDYQQQSVQQVQNLRSGTAAPSPGQTIGEIPDAAGSTTSSPRVAQNLNRASPMPGQSPRPIGVAMQQQQQPVPWKARLEYMLRLSEHLFAEDLLDKPVFLKWCISYFDSCKFHELPAALLFLRAFWTNILRSPNLAQTLALGLLRHHSALFGSNYNAPGNLGASYSSQDAASSASRTHLSPASANHPVIINLRQKLAQYTRTLFIYSPDTFVIPNHWQTLGPVLCEILKCSPSNGSQQASDDINKTSTNLDTADPAFLPELSELYTFIAARNENLIITDSAHVRALRHPSFLVVDALDKARVPFNWVPVTQTIISNKMSSDKALHTAYVWATTNSRTGTERVYTCLALVTYWAETYNWDVSATFIDFLLHSIDATEDYSMSNVYDLLTEFIDRDWFCISTYLRKLISGGVLFIPRLRHLVQAQIQIVANLPTQFFSDNLRNQQLILLNSVGVKFLKDEPQQLHLLSERLYEILDFLSPDYQQPSANGFKGSSVFSTEKDYMELSGDICTQIALLTKGGQLELSMWIVNLFFQKVESTTIPTPQDSTDDKGKMVEKSESKTNDASDNSESDQPSGSDIRAIKPFVPTISQFALLQNLFEVLHDPKSLYRVIESIIPHATTTTLISFLSNCIRDHILIFSALADVPQIIVKLIVRFKQLKIKTRMPRGLWDLATFVLYNMDNSPSRLNNNPSSTEQGNNSDGSNTIIFDLKNELKTLVKPGPGPDGSNLGLGLGIEAQGKGRNSLQQDITSLSPMSDTLPDALFGSDSAPIDSLFGESRPESTKSFNITIDPRAVSRYFPEISAKFLIACQSPYFVSKNSSSSLDLSNPQDALAYEGESSAKEVRKYIRALVRLRDADVETFNTLLVSWLRETWLLGKENNHNTDPPHPSDMTSQQRVERDTQTLTRSLLFLIIYECLTFEKAVETFMIQKNTTSDNGEGATNSESNENGKPPGSTTGANGSKPSGNGGNSAAPSPKLTSTATMGPVNTNNSTANNMANDSNSNSVSNVKPLRVVLNLVSLKFVDAGIRLKASEKLSLNMHRHIFERTHAALFAKCIVREILESAGADEDSSNSHSHPPQLTHSMLFQHHLNLLHQHQKDDTTPSSIVASPNRTLDKTTNSEATQHIFDETDSSFATVSSFLLWLSIADISTFITAFATPIIQSGNKKAIEVSKAITAHLLNLPPASPTVTAPASTSSLRNPSSSITATVKDEVMRLASICNNFNIHLCQVHLRTMLHSLQVNTRQTEDQFLNSTVDAVLDMIRIKSDDTSKPLSPRVLGDLMVHLSKKFKSKLLHRAEIIFLQTPSLLYAEKPSLTESKHGDQDMVVESSDSNGSAETKVNSEPEPPTTLTYLLEIVDAVSDSVEIQTLFVNRAEFFECLEHIVHIAEHFNELENTSGSSDGKENERVVSVDAFKNSTLLLSKIIMIHNASLPSTQGYVTMSNRLINLLARLLSTQFVQVRCQDLFELLFDVLNTIRGGYGFSLATLPVSTEEEENTHGSRSARNSVSGPSGQTAITIPPKATFSRNEPAFWPQTHQNQLSGNPLQSTTSSSTTPFGINNNLESSAEEPDATSLDNFSTFNGSRSTASLMASIFAYQHTIQLSQQRAAIGSEAVSRLLMVRESIVSSMERDDMSRGGNESYLTNLVIKNTATGKYSDLASVGVRSFDLLEDSSYKMGPNDTPISLSMFDGYAEKRNP